MSRLKSLSLVHSRQGSGVYGAERLHMAPLEFAALASDSGQAIANNDPTAAPRAASRQMDNAAARINQADPAFWAQKKAAGRRSRW